MITPRQEGGIERGSEEVESGKGEKADRTVETAPTPAADQAPAAPPSAPVALSPVAQPKDDYLVKVERVLEDNLWTVFAALPPELRQRFKAQGEDTAAKIRALLEQAKVKGKEILKLITDWLKLIPGVNQFFLEQEAKIKTDKILWIAEERRKEQENGVL